MEEDNQGRGAATMLGFHEQMVGELVQEDGMTVMGAGLGMPKVVASLLLLSSAADGVVLILASTESQRRYIREELRAMDPDSKPIVEINNEYTSAERITFYSKGGAYIITSRILIVDLLNERVPLHRVAGILLLNAHKITETCAEAFIVRLYRQVNRKGFLRAFTDRPQAMVSGFSKPERIMKSLFVRKLHLWPRFQLSVSTALESDAPQVVDIRMPLTAAMEGIQVAILEVMDACLKELRKTNKIDVEDLTIESGLFKSFDEIVRRQLDPIWHTVGRKTKQLVGDLGTLRALAEYLLRYDAVTFLKYLDTLRMSESPRSVWIYANPTHRIFDFAKKRVYRIMRVDANGNPIVSSSINSSAGNRGGKTSSKRKTASREQTSVGFGVFNGVQQQGMKRVKVEAEEVVEPGKERPEEETDSHAGTGIDQEAGPAGGEAQGVELEVTVEEMPKWKVLREVLEEIGEEQRRKNSETTEEEAPSQDAWSGSVLVACKDERTCLQLQGVITKGPERLMREEWNSYLLNKAELQRIRLRGGKKKPNHRPVQGMGVYNGVIQGSSDLRESSSNTHAQQEEQNVLMAAAAQITDQDLEMNVEQGSSGKGARGKKRTRGRGRGKGNQSARAECKTIGVDQDRVRTRSDVSKDEAAVLQFQDLDAGVQGGMPGEEGKLSKGKSINLDEAGGAAGKEAAHEGRENDTGALPPVHFYALDSDQRILDVIKPQYVILYDPDMPFVRELEVFKAHHPEKGLKVFFLIYDTSTEGQKFEASIRRENNAFESLIRQKATMMIPVDQDGRMLDIPSSTQSATGAVVNTRKAGGRKVAERQMQVIVDMREFNSSLPCVLHLQNMKIIPVTLEVGDYILSPDICVERKSIADLYSSFSSGRLYHQAEVMTRYYKIPVLLIEFSQDKSFSLQSPSEVGEDILQGNIVSKLSLLVLHFPRLRIVWSRSLHATADIFSSLKSNQDEPDVERAMRVGVPTEDGLIEGDLRAENYNTTAIELLRRLPGVTDANYRSIMDGCNSLAELGLMPVEELAKIMGGNRPARMLRDFLDAKCPVLG